MSLEINYYSYDEFLGMRPYVSRVYSDNPEEEYRFIIGESSTYDED